MPGESLSSCFMCANREQGRMAGLVWALADRISSENSFELPSGLIRIYTVCHPVMSSLTSIHLMHPGLPAVAKSSVRGIQYYFIDEKVKPENNGAFGHCAL